MSAVLIRLTIYIVFCYNLDKTFSQKMIFKVIFQCLRAQNKPAKKQAKGQYFIKPACHPLPFRTLL